MTSDSASPPSGPTSHGSGEGSASPIPWAEPPRSRPTLAVRAGKVVSTLLAFLVVILGALAIWGYYVTSPWTRDGRVRVQVAMVAPQVSGQITQVRIVDNQYVHKGDVLYVIDPFDYRVKLASAKATVKQEAADYQVKREQALRLLRLNDLATNAEAQQQAAASAESAQGAFENAQQQQNQAEVNLQRTQVTSPVNGFVTNLLMRVGDYAETGRTNVSVIDSDSFWVDGYFEETKLGRICVGDRAEAQLMGFGPPIIGEIEAVSRGISVSNAAASTQGLPSVDAVYTWVRLAQRVPVHVHITDVPPGVPLVSGLTATVTVRGPPGEKPGPLAALMQNVHDIFAQPAPRTGCIPPTAGATGKGASLLEPQPAPDKTPEQVDPGLATGLKARPALPR